MFTDARVAVLTNKDDSHADALIECFAELGRSIFRINTEDLATRYTTTLTLSADGGWSGFLTDELGRRLDFRSLRAVWLRKPNFDFALAGHFAPAIAEFVRSEFRSLLDTIYSLPGVRWVNDPTTANRAKSKYQQLILATSLGLDVPSTIITNAPGEVEAFFHRHNAQVLVKAVYNSNVTLDGMARAIPSARVDPHRFDEFNASIALCPAHLQNYIDKKFELRVTVVRDSVMAARIDSQAHEQTKVDWRIATELNHFSKFSLPPHIEDKCRQFIQLQGLQFGAMDFIVTPDDRYVFLENNPFGQYLWLESETGLPITREIARLLIELSEDTSDLAPFFQ